MFVTPGSRAKKRVSGLTFPISGDGKTITADTPLLNLTQTWSNGGVQFTALKLNVTRVASNQGSKLLDLQMNGSTYLSLVPLGGPGSTDTVLQIGPSSGGSFITYITTPGFADMAFGVENVNNKYFMGPHFGLTSGSSVRWCDNANDANAGTKDLFLGRDAASALSISFGGNAMKFLVYNTSTDASNYERASLDWQTTANVFRIRSENAGTGTNRIIAIDGFDKAGAAAASDIPSGTWALIHDTSGATFKLVYNNGGTLKTVALT